MTINNLPAGIQAAIQQGYLEREFHDPLFANRAYRSCATKEPFSAKIGETLTRTRSALYPAVTTPMNTAANTDLNNGLTATFWGLEQYIMTLNQYGFTTDLNLVMEPFAISSVFLQNVKKLAEGAARSIETLAQQAMFNVMLGQNTRVVTTLGAPGVTVAVDDIRGFGNSWTSTNTPVAVSVSNPLSVTFVRAGAYSSAANSANTTGGTYSLTGVTADGTNVSASPGGISGTLTFSANVAVADATAANGVVAAVAPSIQRPFLRATSKQLGAGDVLTMQMLLNAKQTLSANGVEPFSNGMYRFIVDPFQVLALYQDPAFQRFFISRNDSSEYRRGVISDALGIEIVETRMAPIHATLGVGAIHRGMLLGDGVMIESDYTPTGYAALRNGLDDELITLVDGVAHVTRPPLDRLGQVITQSWTWIGGFVLPTDLTTTTTTVPTAGNSAWKRGLTLESVQT
jgi:hypothetical protein